MVPLAIALSRSFALAAFDLSISAHCARGIFQNATYEYIGGFSLTSDICANAGKTQTADIVSTLSPAKNLHSFLFMILILRDLARDPWGTWPGRRQCTPVVRPTLRELAEASILSLNFSRTNTRPVDF